MKKILMLALISLFFTSCSAQQFEDTTAVKPRIIMTDFDVVAVHKDGTTLSSNYYRVHFFVENRDLEINRQYFMVLEVKKPFDRNKVNHAKLLGHRTSAKQLEADRRELLRSLGLL